MPCTRPRNPVRTTLRRKVTLQIQRPPGAESGDDGRLCPCKPGLRTGAADAQGGMSPLYTGAVDLAELDYDLPPALIAQAPAPSRDASRLLLIDRARQTFEDRGLPPPPAGPPPGGAPA